MGVAVLLFGLLVGIFHFQGADEDPQQKTLSAEPPSPASYEQATVPEPRKTKSVARRLSPDASFSEAYAGLAATVGNKLELSQTLANFVAAQPDRAARLLTIALSQNIDTLTLGDVAALTATATKAAPEQALSIAGVVARSFRDQSDPALAAAIATIVSLVPEQSREIGLVVGAVVGDDPVALGMVAQTIAISVGQETFSSLSEGSGITISALMRESSRFGVNVPFDVPNYAAQLAPTASMLARSDDSLSARTGGM
jgi:hypothetical protein